MLTRGKTHLNICVLQMVLRYSDVGGVYYWYVSKVCQRADKHSFVLNILPLIQFKLSDDVLKKMA